MKDWSVVYDVVDGFLFVFCFEALVHLYSGFSIDILLLLRRTPLLRWSGGYIAPGDILNLENAKRSSWRTVS